MNNSSKQTEETQSRSPRERESDIVAANEKVAGILDRIADLLEMQDANPFRVRAYRNAASTVKSSKHSVAELVREGNGEALQELPGIGEGLSAAITEIVHTGRSSLLQRLQGEVSPVNMYTQVPGIGEELAERIASELDISSLEELEQAAHDGRLQQVEGFGPKRVENVKVSIAGMLSGAAQRRIQRASSDEDEAEEGELKSPSVEVILDVDAEYRHKAETGELRKIAPRRFNPEGEAWLPILHTERESWDFTALYSNTARAHELGTTRDWVVIYYNQNGDEDQATVVTEQSGPLEGKRVVRGREAECRRYYEAHE